MARFFYVPEQGNIPHVSAVELPWYQGINNFFTRGGYSDLYNRSRGAPVINTVSAISTILTESQYNSLVTNVGAVTDTPMALPIATPGLEYRFRIVATQYIKVSPNGSDIIEGLSIGQGIQANTPYSKIHLTCYVSGIWDIDSQTGIWGAF